MQPDCLPHNRRQCAGHRQNSKTTTHNGGPGRRKRKTFSRMVSTSPDRCRNAASFPARQVGPGFAYDYGNESWKPQTHKMKRMAGAGYSRFWSRKPHKMVVIFGCPGFVPAMSRHIYVFTGTYIVFVINGLRLFFSLSRCPGKYFAFWRCRFTVLP